MSHIIGHDVGADIELGPQNSDHLTYQTTLPRSRTYGLRRRKISAHSSAAEKEYIELSTCRGIESSPEALHQLLLLKSLIDRFIPHDYDTGLHSDFHPSEDAYQRLLWLICRVVRLCRSNNSMSINRILEQLDMEKSLIGGRSGDTEVEMKHLIFQVICWISLLFLPSISTIERSQYFRIDAQGARTTGRTTAPIEKSSRPIDELLLAFGGAFPRESTLISVDSLPLMFKVSYVNASTLKALGNMQFIWVDNITSHLIFDPTIPSLCLFRSPSFCKLQQSDDSILSTLCKNLYTEEERPTKDFSIPNLLREILLSYSLIFRADQKSRNLYRYTERKRASLDDTATDLIVDPVLDDLCGMNLSTSIFDFGGPVHESYNANGFPILRGRIKRLQDYMEGIQPNRFISLWRDRRDMKLWYTIWAVLILGLVSVIQSTVSIGLAAAQLEVAEKSYRLQQSQGGGQL